MRCSILSFAIEFWCVCFIDYHEFYFGVLAHQSNYVFVSNRSSYGETVAYGNKMRPASFFSTLKIKFCIKWFTPDTRNRIVSYWRKIIDGPHKFTEFSNVLQRKGTKAREKRAFWKRQQPIIMEWCGAICEALYITTCQKSQ